MELWFVVRQGSQICESIQTAVCLIYQLITIGSADDFSKYIAMWLADSRCNIPLTTVTMLLALNSCDGYNWLTKYENLLT